MPHMMSAAKLTHLQPFQEVVRAAAVCPSRLLNARHEAVPLGHTLPRGKNQRPEGCSGVQDGGCHVGRQPTGNGRCMPRGDLEGVVAVGRAADPSGRRRGKKQRGCRMIWNCSSERDAYMPCLLKTRKIDFDQQRTQKSLMNYR